MVLKKTKGYQDIDGNLTLPISKGLVDPDTTVPQEIEMASVSVVPDDTFTVTQAVNALGFGWFQVKLSLWTGLCWMADSMEMTILSILSPALHCTWHITRYQQALTTTIVFLGMMLSSTFWGNLSDRYGRKHATPSFMWMLLLRGLVGFAIGCTPQSVTLYAEFLPTQQRAKCVVLLDCFWALGACFEVALALIVMPILGWQWLLALSTGPLLAFAMICPWLPESARYHVASGQTEKALETLEKIAKDNGIFITIFIIERYGRKKTMAVQFVTYAICCCFLVICPGKRTVLTLMLFLARGIIAGVFQAAYVYTPEVYPTSLRSVGVGSCSAMARLGAMVTPYVAQVLLKTSITFATSTYAVAALLASIACMLLPIETAGKELPENTSEQRQANANT
ncbi:hypothetical protein YQE_08748, partial [Dendroctonus ponderosae]